MTTIDLYRKHKAGGVSRENFLYEVRRDNNLPFITNLTSYDDAVKILKNKGIVTEAEDVKAEVKPKVPSTKKPKSLHIDIANPYEYRHGLQHELGIVGDYTDEAFENAKVKVLKNLAKDANYYTTLLNQKQSPYEFKTPESQGKNPKLRPSGHLKKEAKKDEKSNVKNNLGKKEAGKLKPKGVKIMPDKGVTGTQKTIKEGIERKIDWDNISEKDADALYDYHERTGKLPFDLSAEKYDEIMMKLGWDKRDNRYLKMHIDPADINSNDDDTDYDNKNYSDGIDDYDSEHDLGIDEAKAKKYVVFDIARGENASKSFNTKEEAEAELKKINAEDPHHGDYVIDINESMEEFRPGVNLGNSFDKMKQDIKGNEEDFELADENAFEDLMKKYDWYYEMSDDHREWEKGNSVDHKLRALGKKIGAGKAIEIFNRYAPTDRKAQPNRFTEDKHAKIKAALKKGLKELINPKDIQAAKSTGDVVNIPAQDTTAQTAAKNAKINFRTYK